MQRRIPPHFIEYMVSGSFEGSHNFYPAYVLCSIQHFLHIKLCRVHFVLYTALFAHQTLPHTFCALYSTFCTSNSAAYILCSIQHFLHIKLCRVHFVLYTALFAHQTLPHTFCALYSTLCTSNSPAYALYSTQHFLHIKLYKATQN